MDHRGAEQGFGMSCQQGMSMLDVRHRGLHFGLWRTFQRMQSIQHCIDTAQHMRLNPSETAQTEFGQVLLQMANVTLTDCQVVQQIQSAFLARAEPPRAGCYADVLMHGPLRGVLPTPASNALWFLRASVS